MKLKFKTWSMMKDESKSIPESFDVECVNILDLSNTMTRYLMEIFKNTHFAKISVHNMDWGNEGKLFVKLSALCVNDRFSLYCAVSYKLKDVVSFDIRHDYITDNLDATSEIIISVLNNVSNHMFLKEQSKRIKTIFGEVN